MNKNTIYSFVDVWEVFIAEGKFGYIGADPLFSRTHLLVSNKTISDGGITVDFSIIKVHTSN